MKKEIEVKLKAVITTDEQDLLLDALHIKAFSNKTITIEVNKQKLVMQVVQVIQRSSEN